MAAPTSAPTPNQFSAHPDRRTIDGIVDSASPTQYGLRSFMHAIAASPLVRVEQLPQR